MVREFLKKAYFLIDSSLSRSHFNKIILIVKNLKLHWVEITKKINVFLKNVSFLVREI